MKFIKQTLIIQAIYQSVQQPRWEKQYGIYHKKECTRRCMDMWDGT